MTSAVAGYLTPVPPPPDYDTAFDDFFHDVIAGVTGLDNKLVRPRWQADPPTMPKRDVTWVGFGVSGDTRSDVNAYESIGTVIRHEEVTVLCSFYGPQANGYAALLRDGLALGQNRFALDQNNVGLIEAIGPRTFAELVKEVWIRRADLAIRLRREIRREYAILSVLWAHGAVVTETPELDFDFEAGADAPLVPQLDYSSPDGAIYAMAVGT